MEVLAVLLHQLVAPLGGQLDELERALRLGADQDGEELGIDGHGVSPCAARDQASCSPRVGRGYHSALSSSGSIDCARPLLGSISISAAASRTSSLATSNCDGVRIRKRRSTLSVRKPMIDS